MYVDIDLRDDKTRRLRFNISAFRNLEDAMGGQSIGAIVRLLGGLSFTATVAAIWAGLRHEDRKLTILDTEKLLDNFVENGGDLSKLTRTINDAIGESAAFRAMTSQDDEKNVRTEPATTESR